MASVLQNVGHLNLYVKPKKEDTLTFFARDITQKLKEFREAGKDVLFLSSGGSALQVLDRIDKRIIAPYLTIGIFDERYDPTNKTSNYAQLRKTSFWENAVKRGCRLIDTSTQRKQTQQELADYYEDELRKWRSRHPYGIIMATFGVALDGHIAGIMSMGEDKERFHDLFEKERWIIAYDTKSKNPFPLRVTTTFTFLQSIDIVGVYFVGKEKGSMFKRLVEGDDLVEMPGRIIKTLLRGAIYTDQALIDAAGMGIPDKAVPEK